MAELLVYVRRHGGSLAPCQVPAAGSLRSLYDEVAKMTGIDGCFRLTYQGERLPSDETLLADSGLSNEAVVECVDCAFAWDEGFCHPALEQNGPHIVSAGRGRCDQPRFAWAGPCVSHGVHTWKLVSSGLPDGQLGLCIDPTEGARMRAVVLDGQAAEIQHVSGPQFRRQDGGGRVARCYLYAGMELTVTVDLSAKRATFGLREQTFDVDLGSCKSVAPFFGCKSEGVAVTLSSP
eukprot:TRINITY_DN543_c0_g1_i1.p1 TRINITY_DN543_c0_g1~~TRINITY_DN543_c0_g1_i1.p1  ORF type:complete len:265 (+),score=79.45 TRINITY_DN543_c0_g1_i1:91-795(+)